MIKEIIPITIFLLSSFGLFGQIKTTTPVFESDTSKCNNGDVGPDYIPGGTINWTRPCAFKNIEEYRRLFDPLQPIYWVHNNYWAEYGIGDLSGGYIQRGHLEASHSENIALYERDTVGDTISVNGMLYQRYMPILANRINHGEYSVGWSDNVALPRCGCLRRITVEKDVIHTKQIEILYAGSGRIVSVPIEKQIEFKKAKRKH